jgi:glycosyltransferase involved in cell wall biosynthesis
MLLRPYLDTSTMIDPNQPDYAQTPIAPQRPHFDYVLVEHPAPPCVTIVTPFYNTGLLFHDTARSVLQQSLQQWRWLIINDGSTEPESLTVLATYRQRDPRIQVLDHETNRGLSAARNTGFRQADTTYVVQLDSDDLLEPTALEKWLWFLESYPEYAFVKGYTVGFGAQEYLWSNGFHAGAKFLDQNLVAPTSMIRAAVCQEVGGYDETNRAGLEDWAFWLHCANLGYWGDTIPEYLDWYRRRPAHNDRWGNWDDGPRQQAFQAHLRCCYPQLWQEGFPQLHRRPHVPNAALPDSQPCANTLRKTKPRLLLLVPWLTIGGADKFNLDMLAQLTQRGWEITIATTLPGDDAWLPLFARYTPDIFLLPHFLRLVDYPRFLRYLMQSRQVDTVMVSNSELGYLLLPYLRAQCPDVAFVDFCHMEEEHWKNGGYPRLAVHYQGLLDLNIVASSYLRNWMAQQGADPQRIQTCYINVDADIWYPEPQTRVRVRQELQIDEATPVVLYAGRICTQKQPQVFAHTVQRLAHLGVRFVALVAGDGPDLMWLRGWLGAQHLEAQVRALGAVPSVRMRALMTAADVFFLPSQAEGIAMVLYEAMACGLPVVGADVGGQRELVTPACGVLLPRGTVEQEAERYGQVLAELLTQPARRRAMGLAGRARVVAEFRVEQMGERIVTLLAEARRFHDAQPRPTPDAAYSSVWAAQAIEYMRLREEAAQVWQARLDWQQTAETWEQQLQEQRTWITQLEQGKAWLEQQWASWQHTAVDYEQRLQAQRAWSSELEHTKTWLEDQRTHWQLLAEERAQQCQAWQHTAQAQQRYLDTLQSCVWFRLLARLRLLPAWLAPVPPSPSCSTQVPWPEEIAQ